LFLEKSKCGEGDIWDKLISARREAVLQMIVDCSVHLDNRYATLKPYSRGIGESGYSSLLSLSDGKKSIKFKTRDLSGAKLQFTGVGLIAKLLSGNEFETIRITFTNKTKGEIVKVIDFDVRMRVNAYSVNADTSIYEMPYILLDCDGSEYEISYDLDTTKLMVYDNKLTCTCGGVRKELYKYYEVLPDGNAFGLLFNVNYICDENYLLCALSSSILTVRFLIAEGIRCLTMYKFLNNSKSKASGASVENVLNTNGLDDLLEQFSNKYNNVLLDIGVKTLTMPNFGCFTCNPYNQSRREGILVSDPFLDANKNLNQIYRNPFDL
jgi:hypothetical protein